MATKALTTPTLMPSVFDDFFKPWNQWFDDSSLVRKITTMPAVNIIENEKDYMVTLAAPGLKKDDFTIKLDRDMLTISSEKEENKEEKEENFTRKEYSFTSFLRTFTLPDDVKQDAIEAKYEEGVLKIKLPRKEEAKKATAYKTIAVK